MKPVTPLRRLDGEHPYFLVLGIKNLVFERRGRLVRHEKLFRHWAA
jgi:hypothetical protein